MNKPTGLMANKTVMSSTSSGLVCARSSAARGASDPQWSSNLKSGAGSRLWKHAAMRETVPTESQSQLACIIVFIMEQ